MTIDIEGERAVDVDLDLSCCHHAVDPVEDGVGCVQEHRDVGDPAAEA
ncbi:hypothetical protein [Lentzea albidocapillata]|nr:hypothetical protein [Lentzea albidocapillata]